jgi:O-antigen biosynthesis protein
MQLDLSIIIVNYNVKEFLQNLLHSIAKSALNISYEIIIVDNASDDGSVEFIKDKFPDVKLISNNKNLGFSKANNLGLKIAQGKYILLLNPDALLREDTLQKMIEFFKNTPDAGLAGCKILNPDGSLQLACRRNFPGPWTSFCKVTGLSSLFPKSRIFARYNLTYMDENQTYEVDAISGSFMMMKKEVYEKVGGFDEEFFMYGEDLDLCYRIQKAGYKVYYVHDTQIIHYKGESTKRSSFDETKVFYNAMNLFVKKHLSGSFLVEIILLLAITLRKFFAFMGRRKLILVSILLDLLFFDLSIFLADKLYGNISNWHGFPYNSLPIIYTVPVLIHIVVSSISGIYKREALPVLKNFLALLISFVIISAITFFFKQFAYSRATVLITYVILFFILTLWRIILKIFFKVGLNADSLTHKKTLIVGINSPSIKIANKLRLIHSDARLIFGLISQTNKEVGSTIEGFEVIGTIDNIRKVINERKINEVIIPSEELSYHQIMAIVASCQNENAEFKLIGNNLDFLVGKNTVSVLENIPLIEISYNISKPMSRFLKRLFDIVLASVVLFFIYPFIYLIIKLSKKQTEFRNFVLKVPSVFSGSFSFVGPINIKNSNSLFLGKKGLTGFWYLEGKDGKNSENLDIFYAKNQNIWLDLEILGKSLNKMLGS